MSNTSMINDVESAFDQLVKKYTVLKSNLKKCFEEIKREANEFKTEAQLKKEKEDKRLLKKKTLEETLKSSMSDLPELEVAMEQLAVSHVVENELRYYVNAIKISSEIASLNGRNIILYSKQGSLLKQARDNLPLLSSREVSVKCGFSKSHASLLMSLNDLHMEFPVLQRCQVPLGTFNGNIKIIREICEEEWSFWGGIPEDPNQRE